MLSMGTKTRGVVLVAMLAGVNSFQFPTVVTYLFGLKAAAALGLAAAVGTGANPRAAVNAVKVLNSDTSFHTITGCSQQGPP